MRRPPLHRRLWIFATVAFVAGCSSNSKSGGKKSRGPMGKRPKGPKTMGNMMLDAYMADLKSGSEANKITAARELGNMGPTAKKALPLLEPLASHANPQLSKAAKEAIKSIKK